MNKIIYFTNAVDQNYFVDYLKKWSISPNLSNQNFHHKLISALSLNFDIDVISIRAINKNFLDSKLEKLTVKENNINWLYPRVNNSRLSKLLTLSKRIKEVLPISSEAVIFVDALNYTLVKEAYKYAKEFKLKIIGVCTDNPYNISFTSNLYKKSLFKYTNKFDGYIVLTEGINKVFNPNNKPYIQIDGVSEDIKEASNSKVDGKYIYFGGSLMEEYGVYNLIDAFKKLDKKDLKLVICGHHVNKEKLEAAIGSCSNIIYLGPVSYLDNLNLLKNAVLSVNPRPINPKIDEYSIPSKTLESLAAKTLNVTVSNELLMKNYEDVIIWSKSSNVTDLVAALDKALSLSKEDKEKMINEGYKKVMLRTSPSNISKEIEDFLFKFFLN